MPKFSKETIPFFTELLKLFNEKRSREHASAIEKKRQEVSEDIARLNRESVEQIARDDRAHDWRKHNDLKALQRELVGLNCEAILKAAETRRQATLELPEAQGIMAEWPLRLYPSQILQSHQGAGLVPLRLVPSFLGYGDVELQLDLVNFIETYYPKECSLRPVEILDDTWKPDKPHGQGSIKALFGRLHSEPMLIVRSTCNDNELTCRVAYWGIAAHDSFDKILINRQSYSEILQNSARNNYKTDEAFIRQMLMTCHKLFAAWFIDAHYLVHHNVQPLLPSLLPKLTKDIVDLSIVPGSN
jgi:hypothetical protein